MDLQQLDKQIQKVNKNLEFSRFHKSVKSTIRKAMIMMFPGYFSDVDFNEDFTSRFIWELHNLLSYVIEDQDKIDNLVEKFLDRLPEIYHSTLSDIDAAFRGDPAVTDYNEIILCYPAFRTIFCYRLAHELVLLDIPIIPRAITEYAHRQTGIDIHPGATIGKHFFIDHGTGIVIGQTAIIGDNVTLYQNVTLGSKNFPEDENGNLVKGNKRHPNIGNNVVIYAGATILGDINIGDNSVIGGNVWLTHSIPENSTVTNKQYKQ